MCFRKSLFLALLLAKIGSTRSCLNSSYSCSDRVDIRFGNRLSMYASKAVLSDPSSTILFDGLKSAIKNSLHCLK